MSNWVRNAVMLTVIIVWAIVVLAQLWRGMAPDPIQWGVPGAVWFALNPALPRRRPTTPPAEEP